MNNDTKKLATDLLKGWLQEIHQQNKAIRRKNKLITRLRKETEEREQYLATLKVEFNLHNTALHTLATAMDVQWGGSVRESVDLAIARIAQLSAEHADMVKRNALLRERPDLPVDRIPAHEELARAQDTVDTYRRLAIGAYNIIEELAPDTQSDFLRRITKAIEDDPLIGPTPLREGDNVHITLGNGETVDCVVSESITMKPMNVEGTLTGRMKMPLPTAYGDCTCECHRTPGVMHVMPCCYPDKETLENVFGTTDGKPLPEFLMVTTAVQEVDELAAAESALGAWLSAAMDDPTVCPEMKRDITRWMTAIERDAGYPTAWAYENACKALDMHRERADKAEARVKEIQEKNSILYTRLQKHREDINRIRELVERIT